ncbi:hypothetical protein OG535_07865 [Kitasatospora sp. NBC_00085]|uniref:LGFP repeat-containing protein n=1 Tax=unclassified Kitasatospora TaxID=2633591 RepID=UPI0032451702
MYLGAALQRRIRGRIGSGLGVLTLLASLIVVAAASPAQAGDTYCGNGKNVVGDIEKRYIEMNGPDGPLGCPLTDELVNPDGFGRRTQFQNGTIYWSPRSGAWPVWGAIGGAWCDLGCERGWPGYPTSYEVKAGDQIHQNFQCAVIYFQAVGGGASKTWTSENLCL